MSREPIVVLDLVFDDENRDKMAAHSITASQALQVLNNGARFGRNRKRRRAAYLMIGRDDGGACIAIPLEPTRERRVWRPVTAWYCKRHELDWLPR